MSDNKLQLTPEQQEYLDQAKDTASNKVNLTPADIDLAFSTIQHIAIDGLIGAHPTVDYLTKQLIALQTKVELLEQQLAALHSKQEGRTFANGKLAVPFPAKTARLAKAGILDYIQRVGEGATAAKADYTTGVVIADLSDPDLKSFLPDTVTVAALCDMMKEYRVAKAVKKHHREYMGWDEYHPYGLVIDLDTTNL